MQPNFLFTALAALVPMIIGFIWYNPKVMGSAWMRATGLTEEQLKKTNMAVVFGVTLLLSLMLSFGLTMLVIHQVHLLSIVANAPGVAGRAPGTFDSNSEAGRWVADSLARYGDNFRTFKHGAFHGVLSSIFLALPILGIVALFERKGAKYIFIHLGYWAITMGLMGGLICAFT